jgi:hypothetical protein
MDSCCLQKCCVATDLTTLLMTYRSRVVSPMLGPQLEGMVESSITVTFVDLMTCIRRSSRLAFVVRHVAISRSGTRKFGSTSGTKTFGCCAGLLSLVPKKVTKSRKLPSVAPMLPTLRFRSRIENAWHYGAVLSARSRGKRGDIADRWLRSGLSGFVRGVCGRCG